MFESLSTTGSIIAAILGFGFIIFVHELGHFLAAKMFKVHVKAFSLGFPPNILHKQVGETDYRLGLIPMGGYVSMVGEDPTEKVDDPRALSNQKPWKRAVVFLAGVGMNILSAIIIYMVASIIGIHVTPPVTAGPADDSPAQIAGVQAGDVILAIDGTRIEEFGEIQQQVLAHGLDNPDHAFAIDILRDGRQMRLTMQSKPGDFPGTEMKIPQLGLMQPFLPVISLLQQGSPAAQAGFKKGDRILSVNGQPVDFQPQAQEALDFPQEPMTIVVLRPADDGGEARQVTLTVNPQEVRMHWYGLVPPIYVMSVMAGSPAEKAGLQVGDRVLDVEGVDQPLTMGRFSRVIRQNAGQELRLTVLRDGKRLPITVTPQQDPVRGRPLIGIGFADFFDDKKPPRIIAVSSDSPLASSGIPEGALITRIGEKEVGNWMQYAEAVIELKGDPVEVAWRMPESQDEHKATITPQQLQPDSLLQGSASLEVMRKRLPPEYNPVAALGKALKRVKFMAFMQYVTIKGLFVGRVPAEELGGPIRIGTSFYQAARSSFTDFMMFLALVSIAIALLNIMPIPPLDGGHVMFLAVEKATGRPVNDRVRSVITLIGTVLLLSLVVLVFYNDIKHVITRYFS